jgi:hypothetical protein
MFLKLFALIFLILDSIGLLLRRAVHAALTKGLVAKIKFEAPLEGFLKEMVHVLFEILPVNLNGPSLITVRHH